MPKIIPSIADLHQSADKTALTELAQQHAQQIVDSNYDLMTTYVALKRYEVYLKNLIAALQTPTTELIKAEGVPPKEYANAKITVTRRRKYDFSQDETWSSIQAEVEQIKAYKKEREAFLKTIESEYTETVNEETGEVVRTYAPPVEVTEGIMVRLE
ncbi:MAG: hypothetical protein AB8G22_07010 [Saprospiraceae bacterium]